VARQVTNSNPVRTSPVNLDRPGAIRAAVISRQVGNKNLVRASLVKRVQAKSQGNRRKMAIKVGVISRPAVNKPAAVNPGRRMLVSSRAESPI
jgi:hypothetical protein